MRLSHSNLGSQVISVWKLAADGVKVRLYQSDRPARACACVHAVLNINPKIFLAFVFLRGHEFDVHFLGTAWNRLVKLKIAGF
jgi:hypothetical protein